MQLKSQLFDQCVVIVDAARTEASRVGPEGSEQDPGGHQRVERLPQTVRSFLIYHDQLSWSCAVGF